MGRVLIFMSQTKIKFTLLTKVKSAFFYRAALSITIIKSLNYIAAYGYFCTVVRVKVAPMS